MKDWREVLLDSLLGIGLAIVVLSRVLGLKKGNKNVSKKRKATKGKNRHKGSQ